MDIVIHRIDDLGYVMELEDTSNPVATISAEIVADAHRFPQEWPIDLPDKLEYGNKINICDIEFEIVGFKPRYNVVKKKFENDILVELGSEEEQR